jgi:hypothetical protein
VRLTSPQLDKLEGLSSLPVALALGDPALLEPVRHVVEDGHVREQRVRLEHCVDVAPVGRGTDGVDATDQDLALVRLFEAGDQPEGGGLAAPRGTEQREELTPPDFEVDGVHGRQRAEPFGHGVINLGFVTVIAASLLS